MGGLEEQGLAETAETRNRRQPHKEDYGGGAFINALGMTILFCLFGCWWSLLCTTVGIVIAVLVSDFGRRKEGGSCIIVVLLQAIFKEKNEDLRKARTLSKISRGFSAAGCCSAVMGTLVIVATILGIIFSRI